MTHAGFRVDMELQDKSKPIVNPTRAREFHHGHDDGGSGKTVAIRDSGIDETHPIFDYFDVEIEKPEIDGLPTDGVDRVGHGTMVASLVVLASPNVDKLISVPIFGDSGRTSLQVIQDSYGWLMANADRIDYVNDSWGASREIPQIDSLHNDLEEAGVDSIVAAGNTDETQGSPATADRAFSVAGVNLDETMARFSSPTDDVSGLAVNVAAAKSKDADMGNPVPEAEYDALMEDIGGDWNYASGTSFAAPRLCGYASTYTTEYVREQQLAVEPDHGSAFEVAFIETAEDVKGTDEDGRGYLHYQRAVEEGQKEPPGESDDPDEECDTLLCWLLELIRRFF